VTALSRSRRRTAVLSAASSPGSDVWTPVERQLFRNAFHAHKKDFYLIQKKVKPGG